MELIFTGTSAADFSPLLKTTYAHTFGKDARRSSGLLLDRHIQIDCGYHTVGSLGILGVPLSDITDILITHTHQDHFLPEEIEKIAAAPRHEKLRVWIHGSAASACSLKHCEVIGLTALRSVKLGAYEITPLDANHTGCPLHYSIEGGHKRVFYGCDGAWLLTDTYYFLKDKHLDMMILDGTVGDYTGDYRMAEHNSIPMIRLMLPSLRNFGVIDEHTQVWLSHIAPSLHKSHAETEAFLRAEGLHLAYDGLTVNI